MLIHICNTRTSFTYTHSVVVDLYEVLTESGGLNYLRDANANASKLDELQCGFFQEIIPPWKM